MINVWIAFSSTAITQFKLRRSQGAAYSGPMDEKTYKIMRRMADADNVQRHYKDAVVGPRTYSLFSIVDNVSLSAANAAITYLTDTWTVHVIPLGAWWLKSGLQIGTIRDENGDVTGTPALPIHAQAWRLMPDVVTYDDDGVETSRTPATTNADLRDVALLYGQKERLFA